MTTLVRTDAAALERLRHIVAAAARVEPDTIGPDDDLMAGTGLDSLSLLRVVAAIEKEFGVVIPDAALHELRTLNDIVETVRCCGGP